MYREGSVSTVTTWKRDVDLDLERREQGEEGEREEGREREREGRREGGREGV